MRQAINYRVVRQRVYKPALSCYIEVLWIKNMCSTCVVLYHDVMDKNHALFTLTSYEFNELLLIGMKFYNDS